MIRAKYALHEALRDLDRNLLPSSEPSIEKLIRDTFHRTELSSETIGSLAAHFFRAADTDRLTNGIVETPSHIADFIVRSAAQCFLSVPIDNVPWTMVNDIKWHDPCVGAGAFPLAILRLYEKLHKSPPRNINDLPRIYLTDISARAIFLTLASIDVYLNGSGISTDEYLKSGRFGLSVQDELVDGEMIDLWSEAGSDFDVIVGNPPYVRATRLKPSYRALLKQRFPTTYYGSADLYGYFIANGIARLRESGVLAFITPAGFIRTRSTANIRQYILRSAALCSFVDLDESPVFPDADLHAAIFTLRKGAKQEPTIPYTHLREPSQLDGNEANAMLLPMASADLPPKHGWSFHTSDSSLRNIEKTFSHCVPLSQAGIRIYSGIRPGVSKAFVLKQSEIESFGAEVRSAWLKPVLLAANIVRWQGAKALHNLIFTPQGCESPPQAIMERLSEFKDQLMKRPEVRLIDTWYMLRPCAYYHKMHQRKIIFPDLSAKQRFALTSPEILVLDGAYFIDSDDLALLGILNSGVARQYFINRCSSVGSLGSNGRFRFKKTFVQEFPVPSWFWKPSQLRVDVECEVRKILDHGETKHSLERLDEAVMAFYTNPQ